MNIFQEFEHFFLPISIINENNNNWARNYKTQSNYFFQIWDDLRSDLPKILVKQTTTTKEYLKKVNFQKFDHFSRPTMIIKEKNNWARN